MTCNEGHVFAGPPSSLRVTHAGGVAVGCSFWCEQCSSLASVPASAQHIATLFEMGVHQADEETVLPPAFVSEQRRLVSWRYLPGDAGLLAFVTASDPREAIEP